MSATYTPSDVIDMSKEKEWSAALGMLDWDATSIVFTKRSLIEFLKYTGTTVDTNFGNIQKLPKWAKFGKISSAMDPSESVASITSSTSSATASEAFKPSRRVRQTPGGGHTDIFSSNEDDALSQAPPKEITSESEMPASSSVAQEDMRDEDEHSGINFTSQVKPSRRVRTVPGGNSSLSNFWNSNEQEEFKPTRRVRQGPGGQDSISGVRPAIVNQCSMFTDAGCSKDLLITESRKDSSSHPMGMGKRRVRFRSRVLVVSAGSRQPE
ncbi:hypothetical protein EV359DRAFT_85572 [Lentinula novae-zelandiae]|nr:hypothetical protein EV359DRAFT_85572 [Lentinula novae-zelandiae]